MCTDSKFGFEESSEFIIFNFKKDYIKKIEVIFKTQIDRNQIAIGDLQIFYTESDAVNQTKAQSCAEVQIVDEKFDKIDVKVWVLPRRIIFGPEKCLKEFIITCWIFIANALLVPKLFNLDQSLFSPEFTITQQITI